jgi:hypothetical protein
MMIYYKVVLTRRRSSASDLHVSPHPNPLTQPVRPRSIKKTLHSPVTTTSPASKYWGIDQSIRYGTSTILPLNAGIVDTGTTLILIASDAFAQYVSLTGAVFDNSVGLLSITPAQYANLKSLFFVTGGVSEHSFFLCATSTHYFR